MNGGQFPRVPQNAGKQEGSRKKEGKKASVIGPGKTGLP